MSIVTGIPKGRLAAYVEMIWFGNNYMHDIDAVYEQAVKAGGKPLR